MGRSSHAGELWCVCVCMCVWVIMRRKHHVRSNSSVHIGVYACTRMITTVLKCCVVCMLVRAYSQACDG